MPTKPSMPTRQQWETASPYILGTLSTAGDIWMNQQNRAAAKDQQDFQERMSNTAAQRAVKDYQAAGLNPALAYDRGASSPSGASAMVGNPLASGIGTAQAARALKENLHIAKETARNIRADTQKKETETATARLQGDSISQQILFANQNQPYDLRLRAANALLQEFRNVGEKNTADFERMMQQTRPGIGTARMAAELLKLLTGGNK